MVHDKGGLGGSICMYSVISKTTVLFVREVRALGIFGPSVAPRHRAKKCVIFSRANIFRVRIFFATSRQRRKLVICTGGSAQLLGDHVIP
jgi:hypothetical protein